MRALRFFGGVVAVMDGYGFSRSCATHATPNSSETGCKNSRPRSTMKRTDVTPMHLIPKGPLLRTLDVAALRGTLETLPEEFREVIVMRELKGLSSLVRCPVLVHQFPNGHLGSAARAAYWPVTTRTVAPLPGPKVFRPRFPFSARSRCAPCLLGHGTGRN